MSIPPWDIELRHFKLLVTIMPSSCGLILSRTSGSCEQHRVLRRVGAREVLDLELGGELWVVLLQPLLEPAEGTQAVRGSPLIGT